MKYTKLYDSYSFTVFVKDYKPFNAAGISLFHSIAAFNNSGFDILGGFRNLIPYKNNVMLNLVGMGIPLVISKANSAEDGEILEKLGAEVVYPERDMAIRLASRLET